jgi:branched-chain amino acid transport system substrate-binding protein
MKKTLIIIVSIVIAGCLFSATPALAEDDVIKFGTIFSRTGPLANLGIESWRGAELARIVQNEMGGILGKKIEFVNRAIVYCGKGPYYPRLVFQLY